jgi:hypothetical protein
VASVGVAKLEAGRDASFDDELPAVDGAVVRRAQNNETLGIVISSLGAKPDVVNVEKNPVTAAWNHAATAVSPHDLAPGGGRDVMARAGLTHRG